MVKFEYLSGKRIKKGGIYVDASNLTKLDKRTLQNAVKQNVIKEKTNGNIERKKGNDQSGSKAKD
jgi:hypothetical protein